ncbi:hypothetical protein [Bacillus suaedaesalsae]|uniref:Yip1 domain-containing protein n=1 Tax=Bacillus suaedaesalsae TaxID=2810349 RepID=A0ABS2DF59_9BACI|nr:hypothetical protein [Bacillus suaedaesalsae]MBM6617084.1 hypothetical protein [Bacillus suaedaesalsae]
METNLGVIREIFQPKSYINRLSIKEDLSIKPVIRNVLILLVFFVFTSFLYSMIGYRTEGITTELSKEPNSYIETLQWLHTFGMILKAIVYPLFYLVITSLTLHLFFREISIKVLFYIGQYFLVFMFLYQTIHLILFHYWGIPVISSPFSLGVVMQIVTDKSFVINLSSYVNLFYLGGVALLILLINQQTERRVLHTSLYIIGIHLLLALIGACLSIINVDALLL